MLYFLVTNQIIKLVYHVNIYIYTKWHILTVWRKIFVILFHSNEWMNEWMNEWCIYIALYCVLLYTQSTLQSCGGSLLNHHQCAASTWMMWRLPSALATHQLQVERRESHRANQVDGDYLEAMFGKGQWWEFGQDTGVTPLLFYKKCHMIFNDHRESGPWFNVSSERLLFDSIVSPSLHWGVKTHTDCRVSTPCWSH